MAPQNGIRRPKRDTTAAPRSLRVRHPLEISRGSIRAAERSLARTPAPAQVVSPLPVRSLYLCHGPVLSLLSYISSLFSLLSLLSSLLSSLLPFYLLCLIVSRFCIIVTPLESCALRCGFLGTSIGPCTLRCGFLDAPLESWALLSNLGRLESRSHRQFGACQQQFPRSNASCAAQSVATKHACRATACKSVQVINVRGSPCK